MDVRGQSNIVAIILLIAISSALVTTYHFFAQSVFRSTAGELSRAIEHHHELAMQQLEISSATVTFSDPVSEFSLRIVNTGDVPVVPYDPVTIYIYKGDVLIYSLTSSCGVITPENPCTLQFPVVSDELRSRKDFADLTVYVYVNEVPLTSRVEFIGSLPGGLPYNTCHSCDECSRMISSSTANLVIVDIDGQASGDCIQVDGARDVRVSCVKPIRGNGTGVGLYIKNARDLQIDGCEVTGFSTGLMLENSDGLSLVNVYSHGNTNFDVFVSDPDFSTICSLSDLRLVADYGPIVWNPSGTQSLLSVSAVWLSNTSDATVRSESGTLLPASKVSPAVALCNVSNVRVSDLNVFSVPAGIYVRNSSNFELSSLSVRADRGITVHESAGGLICCAHFYSKGIDLFERSDVEWEGDTAFYPQ